MSPPACGGLKFKVGHVPCLRKACALSRRTRSVEPCDWLRSGRGWRSNLLLLRAGQWFLTTSASLSMCWSTGGSSGSYAASYISAASSRGVSGNDGISAHGYVALPHTDCIVWWNPKLMRYTVLYDGKASYATIANKPDTHLRVC